MSAAPACAASQPIGAPAGGLGCDSGGALQRASWKVNAGGAYRPSAATLVVSELHVWVRGSVASPKLATQYVGAAGDGGKAAVLCFPSADYMYEGRLIWQRQPLIAIISPSIPSPPPLIGDTEQSTGCSACMPPARFPFSLLSILDFLLSTS